MSASNPNSPTRGRRRSEQRRKEILSEVQRRERTERRVRRILYGLVAAVMAITFTLVAVWIVRDSSAGSSTASPSGNGQAVTPSGITSSEPYFPLGADDSTGKPVVDVYLDFMCPFCRLFPQVNNQDIERLVDEEAIVLRLHTTTMLDRMSTTGDYSTRAANAAACVYDASPDKFLDFEERLFSHQPPEGSPGLTDDELASHASEAGASSEVKTCIADRRYEQWLHGPVQSDAMERISGTPTIFINGKLWDDQGRLWTKPGKFRAAILSASR